MSRANGSNFTTHRHPISKMDVVVSVAPKSEYVKLYKEAIKGLVKEKEGLLLSIEDCDFIRSKLPSAHTKVYKGAGIYGVFYYDHLFVKYFLNNKNYKYDPVYVAYGTDMFLYSHLYKCIKRKQKKPTLPDLASSSSSSLEKDYHTTKDLLQGNISRISFTTGELSISKIMKNLCEDIKTVLYLNINPLTIEKYYKVCKNMKVLQYVYHIYEISAFFDKIRDDISAIIFLRNDDKEIKHIYDTIEANDISIFFNIYKKIKLLYKYCIPYDFLYINSSNCKKNIDPISHTEFTDDYIFDTGDVSIIPYFKETKIDDNMNKYTCFLTEELYRWIEQRRDGNYNTISFEVRNPKTNVLLTILDIIYVYKNKYRLIERALNKEIKGFNRPEEIKRLGMESLVIVNKINLLIKHNKEEKNKLEEQASNEIKRLFKGFFKLSRGDNEVKNSPCYLYLTINLGTKSYPITFNVITSKIATDIGNPESSRAIRYPFFENRFFKKDIDLLVSQIEQNVYVPKEGSFNYLIDIQEDDVDERDDVEILLDYKKGLNNYIQRSNNRLLGINFLPPDLSHFI